MAHNFKVGDRVKRYSVLGDRHEVIHHVVRISDKSVWTSNHGAKPVMRKAEGETINERMQYYKIERA